MSRLEKSDQIDFDKPISKEIIDQRNLLPVKDLKTQDTPTEPRYVVSINKEPRNLTFSEIFEIYQKRIYNHAYRLTGTWFEAEELTQEAFVRALRALPVKQGSHLQVGDWIYMIVTNLVRDKSRRNKIVKWDSIEYQTGNNGVDYTNSQNIEDDLLKQESSETFYNVLELLPPRYRLCLKLFHLEGNSMDEIAQKMGCSRQAAKSISFRARKAYVILYQQFTGQENPFI